MKTIIIIITVLLFLLVAVPAVYANENISPVQISKIADDIGFFADSFFERTMAEHHIPGAVFVAVENGQVIYAKGYGFADLDQSIPVDPEKTMFCAGSVGKLVNWTALMQLYEAGKFDLHDDINLYLKNLRIPETFPEPVTFHHLLTHTPGFDDSNAAATPDTIDHLLPLDQYLALTLPVRLRPPGQVTQYSNHGAVLSGLLIEDISGMPFDRYVEQNIFKTLDMNYSTFSQPQPERLQPYLATGYHYINGIHVAQPVRIANVMPAGMGYFSGLDMASFLIAHLQLGEFEGKRILAEDTATLMHQTHFRNDLRLPGMAYGFIENYKNHKRLLWHTGTSPDFHSLLLMIPEENCGFFFSMNIVDTQVSRKLLQEFMDYFYPANLKIINPSLSNSVNFNHYAGIYRVNWHAHNTLEKLGVLGRDVLVAANKDGSLMIRFDNAPDSRWINTDENLFRMESLDEYASFAVDENGNAYRLFQGSRPIVAYEKIAWWETSAFHIILQVAVVIAFITFLLTTFISRFFLRKKSDSAEQASKQARFARYTGNLISLLHPLFIVGFLAIQMKIVSGNFDILLYAVLTLPLITVALTLVIAVMAVLAWINSYWALGGRFHYTLLALAALANSWFLYYWNLIGYSV